MKVFKHHTGRWVTVRWKDVGLVHAVLVEVDVAGKRAKVFCPATDSLDTVEFSQVVSIHQQLEVPQEVG